MSDKEEFAFPIFESTKAGADYDCTHPGMSLRDYFAAKALQSVIVIEGLSTSPEAKNADARYAYEYADAMMKARGNQ